METERYSNKQGSGHRGRDRRRSSIGEKAKFNPNSLRFKLPPTFVSSVAEEESPSTHAQKQSSSPGLHAKRESPSQASIESKDSLAGACEKCRHRSEGEDPSVSFNGNVLLSELPSAVISVAHNLEKSKARRSKRLLAEALEGVVERITNAFEHYGINFSMSSDEDDMWYNPASYLLGGIDIQQEAEKKKERHLVMEVFSSLETRSTSKNEMIKDIDKWIARAKNALNECPVNDELNDILDEFNESLQSINKAFRKAKANTSKLSTLIGALTSLRRNGDQESRQKEVVSVAVATQEVNKEDSSNAAEVEEEALEQQKAFCIKNVLTEKDLLAIPGNARKAAMYVIAVLEEGARYASNSQAKAILKSGARQFKTLWDFAEKKIEDVVALEERAKKSLVDVEKKIAEEQQRKKDQEILKSLKDENIELRVDNQQLQEQMKIVVDQLNAEKASKKVSFMGMASKVGEHKRFADGVPNPVAPSLDVLPSPEQVSGEMPTQQENDAPPETSSKLTLLPLDQNVQSVSQISTIPRQSHHSVSNVSSQSSKLTRSVAGLAGHNSLAEADLKASRSSLKPDRSSNLCCVTGENEVAKALELQVSLLSEKLFEAEDFIEQQQRQIKMLQQGCKDELPPPTQSSAIQQPSPGQESSPQTFKKRTSVRGSVDVTGLVLMQRKYDQLERESRVVREEVLAKDSQLQAQRELLDRLSLQIQHLAEDNAGLKEKLDRDEFKVDAGTLNQKQVVMRLKKEFQSETQRLRGHLLREQQRFQAELRKFHLEQAKFTRNTNKENMLIMRGLARFKDATINLLKREGLHDEASQMMTVPAPSLDVFARCEGSTAILTALSTSTKEVLANVQSQLSRAMLNKRLALREVAMAKHNIQRELADSLDKLQKARADSELHEQQLSALEEQNANLADRYKTLVHTNAILEKEMETHRDVLEKHHHLKLEMLKLQRECRESAKENADHIRQLDRERTSLKQSVLEQQSSVRYLESKAQANKAAQEAQFSRYYISKEDRLRNASSMADARSKCGITEEQYEKGMSALRDASETAEQRLAHLARAYSAHAKMRKIRAVVRRAGSRAGEGELNFRKYMHAMEERFYKQAMEWEDKRGELVRQRESAFSKLLEVMTTVKNDSNGLHIESTKMLPESSKCCPAASNRTTSWRDVPPVRKPLLSELPQILTGRSATIDLQKVSIWQVPKSAPDKMVQIYTPCIVDMDVNRWKRIVKDYKRRDDKLAKVGTLRVPPIATLYP